jgi:hypothetical protein
MTHDPNQGVRREDPPLTQPLDRHEDVTKEPGTMAALVFAVGLMFGVALLVLGQFIPSRIVEPQSTTVQSEHVN